MFKLDAFGSDLHVHVNGSTTAFFSRTFTVYMPTPEELAGRNKALAPAEWKRCLAGLPTGALEVAWRAEPSEFGWKPIGTGAATAAFAAALKACAVVADKSSPRNYGAVVGFEPNGDAVATDGFRLTWTESGLAPANRFCLPAALIKPILAFLKSSAAAETKSRRTLLPRQCSRRRQRPRPLSAPKKFW